jgi:hypothetical protein
MGELTVTDAARGAVVRTGEWFFDDPAPGARRFRSSFSEVPRSSLDDGITVLRHAIAFSARTTHTRTQGGHRWVGSTAR